LFAIAVLACVALLAPNGAAAATVVNGDFESGTLNGWNVHRVTNNGNWFAYKGTAPPIKNRQITGPVQAPPQGSFAVISDELNPDTVILYQDVALEPSTTHWLSLLAYYRSYKPLAAPTPDTLSVNEEVLGEQANQQFRIDVMKPSAAIESIDPADVLLTLFRTQPGDPTTRPPIRSTADISAFAGQTVRLRIAVAAGEEILNAGVDDVSISPRPPGEKGSSGGPNRFRLGKAKANRKNGTVTLPVQVPGPGLLRANDKSASAQGAGASKVKKKAKLIKPVTLRARAAGTVKLRLQLTPPARKILESKHKLRAIVAVTYKPNGGSPATLTAPLVFKLKSRPGQRR
jgi:hypothetical protein